MLNSLKLALPAVVLATGLAVSTAEAAPAASGLSPLKSVADTKPLAEKTHWVRRCYWRHGHRHCYRVWHGRRGHWRRW